ncbi:unnamed protein product [Choristocarpus tenellus]
MVPGEHKLPQQVGQALAAEFGVSESYMQGLLEDVADQLARGHTLDLGMAACSGWPSELTSTKMVAIHSINSDNPSPTVPQVTMKMAAKGPNYWTSTINRSLDDMGDIPNDRWIKPKLKIVAKRMENGLKIKWTGNVVCTSPWRTRSIWLKPGFT